MRPTMQVWPPGLRPDALDGLRPALEAVAHDHQDVLYAAGAPVVSDLGPELGALVGLQPHAEHVRVAVGVDAHDEVGSLVAHPPPRRRRTT